MTGHCPMCGLSLDNPEHQVTADGCRSARSFVSPLVNPPVKPGDRVLLVRTTDRLVTTLDLPPGTCGTVSFVDDCGTVHTDWDNGIRLGMQAAAGDRFLLVDPHLMCEHRSRGDSRCLLPQGHTGDPDREKRFHSDLTLLWNRDGYLCNLDGRLI